MQAKETFSEWNVSVYEKMTKTVRSRLTYEHIQLHRFKLVVNLEGREVCLNIRKYFKIMHLKFQFK